MVHNLKTIKWIIIGLWAAVFVYSFNLGWFWVVLFSLFGIFLSLFLVRKIIKFYYFYILLGLLIGFLIIGFRIYFITPVTNISLDQQVGQVVNLTGYIVDNPDYRDQLVRLTVDVDDSKILVVSSPYLDFSYGDLVSLSGRLEHPKNFIGSGGKEFDYVNYLRVKGVGYLVRTEEIEIIGNKRNILYGFLFRLNSLFVDALGYVLPEPYAGLSAGLLLGAKHGLGEKINEDFRLTGLIHIVVLSGYNVTIIAAAIIYLLSYLPRRIAIILGALGIILFAFMVGGGATVVRSSIMACCALLARLVGRNYDAVISLVIAGSIMILINPFILMFDLGFQLSFIATLGLIYFSPFLVFLFRKLPVFLREILATTVAAQLAVAPFLLYKTGELSLISPVANAIVLPFIPLTMFLSFLAGVFGLINWYIALPFSFSAFVFLKFIISTVDYLANLPFAAFNWSINLPILFLVYILYIIFVYHFRNKLDFTRWSELGIIDPLIRSNNKK